MVTGLPSYGAEVRTYDKDTPADKHQITFDKKPMQLVFSDEFNQAERTFANGKDSKWTALEVGDTSNQGMAFYLANQARRTSPLRWRVRVCRVGGVAGFGGVASRG